MDALQRAADALDAARLALQHADLDEAERALDAHDTAVREAVASGRVVVSELAFLAAEQQALLTDLMAVREGVRAESAGATRSAGAARAYLDTRSRG